MCRKGKYLICDITSWDQPGAGISANPGYVMHIKVLLDHLRRTGHWFVYFPVNTNFVKKTHPMTLGQGLGQGYPILGHQP